MTIKHKQIQKKFSKDYEDFRKRKLKIQLIAIRKLFEK